MKTLLLMIGGLSVAIMVGCNGGPESPRGFSLPKGDVEAGKIAFESLHCNACHSIGNIEQLAGDTAGGAPASGISVRLGGETSKTKTYAELVTSVINPSHRLAKGYAKEMIQTNGKSRMPNYNSIMSVSELIDLVTFLESNYTVSVYSPTEYPIVY